MRPNSALSAFFGLLLFAMLVLGLYYVVGFGVGLFAGVGPEVRTVTAIVAITLLLSASIVAGGLHGIGRREDVRQQRAARAAVYEHFLRVQSGAASGGELLGGGRDFLPRDARSLDQTMLLHASADVLKAYHRLRRADGSVGSDSGGREELVHLVRAMRRDLGQRAPDIGSAELTEIMRLPSRAHG
jgi:hypothetical protein